MTKSHFVKIVLLVKEVQSTRKAILAGEALLKELTSNLDGSFHALADAIGSSPITNSKHAIMSMAYDKIGDAVALSFNPDISKICFDEEPTSSPVAVISVLDQVERVGPMGGE
jgi:hypothetical protein